MNIIENEIYTPVPDVPHIINFIVRGEHLEIEHDGEARWLDIQKIKNMVWGEHAGAKEYYPPQKYVVNGESVQFHFRHLWKMGENETWTNLREHDDG